MHMHMHMHLHMHMHMHMHMYMLAVPLRSELPTTCYSPLTTHLLATGCRATE